MSHEDLEHYGRKAANPNKSWFASLPMRWRITLVGAGALGLAGTAVGIVFAVDGLESASQKFESLNPNKPVTTSNNSAPVSPFNVERSWLDDLQLPSFLK